MEWVAPYSTDVPALLVQYDVEVALELILKVDECAQHCKACTPGTHDGHGLGDVGYLLHRSGETSMLLKEKEIQQGQNNLTDVQHDALSSESKRTVSVWYDDIETWDHSRH